MGVRIDHVIYAATDLDATARRLGFEPRGGGRHEGLGTYNRIVPLGGGYLELVGVADPEEALANPFGRGVLERCEGLAGWVVEVDDVAAVASRLGTAVTTIRRAGLSARLTGVAEAMHEPFLPFFLSRDPGVTDPGADGSLGGITWVEVAGDPARLRDWLDTSSLPVRVVDGPAALLAVGIGDRVLR